MSENIEILNHLIEYLQDKIDSGYYKIFYNDLMYDEKTVDCINAINEVIKENKRLNNNWQKLKDEIKESKKICIAHDNNIGISFLEIMLYKIELIEIEQLGSIVYEMPEE